MRILDILTRDQVSVAGAREGAVRTKPEALVRLSQLLASGQSQIPQAEIHRILSDRERLQSTGVGGGVAIPHGAVERIDRIYGALLLCPEPIDFDAIDGAPVGILFAVIGPKRSTGEHLKTLARVSRLLRDESFRQELLGASVGAVAYELMVAEESRVVAP
jgi:nitrogen PTS system EIIA component